MADQADLSHYIPSRLDDAGKFLFWDVDVAFMALIGFGVGVMADVPFIGLGVGLFLAYGYAKLKAGKHPGMATHLLYWFTGMPQPKELPASHIRELNG